MRRTSAILTGIGLFLLLSATGVSLGYASHAQAIPSQSHGSAPVAAPAPALVTAIHVEVLGVPIDRDVQLDAPRTAAPLPRLGIDRSTGLATAPASVSARIGLLSAPAAQADPRVDDGARVASQSTRLLPAASPAVLAAVAFTGAGLLAFFWAPLKKLLVLPVVALYAKISRAEVFENDVRERIFGAIRAQPGISATDLSRAAGVAWGTTIYHLDVLEQTRMVSSVRQGRHRRYFENGAQLAAPKEVVVLLQNPVTKSVVSTIQTAPGLTQKELAAATRMSPQALHWHLARLVGAGLVRKERAGRVVRHFA